MYLHFLLIIAVTVVFASNASKPIFAIKRIIPLIHLMQPVQIVEVHTH